MFACSPTRACRALQARGRLKIYLGYAAGVGKTYQMLEEAQEMQRQGRDVVIGYFEPHGRKDTIAKTGRPGIDSAAQGGISRHRL